MPSDAFLRAAKSPNRQAVVLAAIEAPGTIKRTLSTTADWQASPVLTNLDASSYPGEVGNAFKIVPASLGDGRFRSPPPGFPFYAGRIDATIGVRINPNSGASKAARPTPWFISIGSHATEDQVFATAVEEDQPVYFGVSLPFTLHAPAVGELNAGINGLTVYIAEREQNVFINFFFAAPPTIHLYAQTGELTTKEVDLGAVPDADCLVGFDDTKPAGTTLTYAAEGRNTQADPWTALGAVADGGAVAPFRYYRFSAAFTTDRPAGAALKEISVADAVFRNLSTYADAPVFGALPAVKKISPLSSSIRFLEVPPIGAMSLDLDFTREVGDLIATGYLKNKAVYIKGGYLGLAESEYEPIFTGYWHDYAIKGRTVTVKLRDVLSRFSKRKIPMEQVDPLTGKKVTKEVDLSGNVMDQMLEVMDQLGIPDRLLDRAAFLAVRDNHRLGPDWDVSRKIGGPNGTFANDGSPNYREPVAAMEILNELQVIAGVHLVTMPNGKLTPVLYDPAGAPAETLDATWCNFDSIAGGQKELFLRQLVYHAPLTDDPSGAKDYGKALLYTDRDAEIAWGETGNDWEPAPTKTWEDNWNASDVAVEALAARMFGWFATPHATVRVVCPPRYAKLLPGQVVAVDNLRLPAARANWPGYSSGQKFLVTGKRVDILAGKVTLDLFDLQTGGAQGAGTWVNPIVISGSATPYGATNAYTAAGGTPPYTWQASAGVITGSPGDTINLDVSGGRGAVSLSVTDATHTRVMRLTVPPAAPEAIAPTPVAGGVRLDLTVPDLAPDDVVEIWAGDSSDHASAVLIGTTRTGEYLFTGILPGESPYVWVRVVSEQDGPGPFYPDTGAPGTATPYPGIGDSQLAESLLTPITPVLRGHYADDILLRTIATAGEAVQRIAGIAVEKSQRIDAIATVTSAQGQLGDHLDQVEAALADITGTEDFADTNTYAVGDLVRYESKLYRCILAILATPAPLPTDATYWLLLGDYASLGEMVAANAAAITGLIDTYGETAAAAESADIATTKAGEAVAARIAAGDYATAAYGSQQTAIAYADDAEQAALAASSAANTATTKAGEASTSAASAATSESNADESASQAATSAGLAATSENNADESATAAGDSASLAATKADDSQQSAIAATSAANTATTKAGEASTSAANAATSESNADGSASQAATSAGLAATSESNAGQSATAAFNSAQTASTKADEAGQSAAAADQSALSAQTQSGYAQQYAEQAVSAAEDVENGVTAMAATRDALVAGAADLEQLQDILNKGAAALRQAGVVRAAAGIDEERTVRIDADEAEAEARLALAAALYGDGETPGSLATLEQTLRTYADSESATAEELDILVAQLGGSSAGAWDQITAYVDTDSVLAERVFGVEARLDNTGSGVTLEQRLTTYGSSIDGLSAQYTVKIDNNGIPAGIGLASETVNGTPVSRFIALVDDFIIANPAGVYAVTSMTRSGDTATANIASTAGLVIGDRIAVTGAAQPEYNGLQTLAEVGVGYVRFVVAGTPATPATVAAGYAGIKVIKAVVPFETVGGVTFVKSAVIPNLSADKITAGTLDAANVQVINLSADAIVSGTLDAEDVQIVNLAVENLVGDVLTGKTVQTNSTGFRAILGTGLSTDPFRPHVGYGYLSFFNNLGVELGEISGKTGNGLVLDGLFSGYYTATPPGNALSRWSLRNQVSDGAYVLDIAARSASTFGVPTAPHVYGLRLAGGSRAPLTIEPTAASGAPTHAAGDGTFYPNQTGLWYRKAGAWVQIV